MTDTPEAVSLADQIHAGNGEWMQKAAALLRRIPGPDDTHEADRNAVGALKLSRPTGLRRALMTVMTNEDPADPSAHEPKPVYVVWAESGNCIMWTTNKAQAEACAEKHERPMRTLYDQDVVALKASRGMTC